MIRYFRPIAERWSNFQAKKATIFLAVLAICFIALSLAVHADRTSKLDLEVTRDFQSIHSPVLTSVAEWITWLGNSWTLVAVGVVAALGFFAAKHRLKAVLCLIALIGLPFNYLIKEWFGRPRPEGSTVSVLLPTVGLSYPSGHAMASTMLYGFLAVMCWTNLKESRHRLWATTAVAILPLLIGVSRIYVGAHWFSDVVGGCTAGLLCLLGLTEVYKRQTIKNPQNH